MSDHGGIPCRATPHCDYVGGCEHCRPDQWRAIDVLYKGNARKGTWYGASFEHARRGVHDIAAVLRDAAAELDAAYAEGFRLYDVADNGVIYLCKGRVKR